ncbi:MAG: hypothetical protein ABSC48_02740 [Terracidiphilus sp.]|jgi:hypothetical protein
MKPMKLIWLIAMVASGMMASAAPAPSLWDEPAAALAGQIAEVLGPGQARLVIHNQSTLSNDEIPAIRRLLEQDLKALGIAASGAESANEIRLTLSENQRGRLWVAEVVEGNQTRVAMVEVKLGAALQAQAGSRVTLRKQSVFATRDVVLAALETSDALVAVEPEEIVIYGHSADGWQERKRIAIGQKKPLPRDPRGMILSAASGDGFEASVAGMSCSGSYQPAQPAGEWTIHCRESDDPWPISQSQTASGSNSIKAFYNTARNYFTGVVTPNVDLDLPPFYTAIVIPRPNGSGLLFNGIDGKVQLLETVPLKPIAGARDWGSDFAALQTGCGAGTQIIASGSGEALADSLRAYELPAQEAIPASAPLAMDGTVTALWSAPDGKSVFAVVRKSANPGAADQYEVDRVTASCN